MKYALTGAFCCLLSWCYASGQSQIDSIITTKGAVTLITCGSAISTFQIGDGKNSDYDYRIVDGNVVFIRPIVANPRTTNLVVREGDNIHYMILAFREKVDLSRLKYVLSASNSIKKTTASPEQKPVEEEPEVVSSDLDTVTVGRIADDFMRQKKLNHQYEATANDITLSFGQAMSLNNMVYFCFRIKNKTGDPYHIGRVTLMHKTLKDSTVLEPMPVLYKKIPAVINGRGEQNVVYVTAIQTFKKNDEVITVLYDHLNKNQVVLYTPASALPKYMISK
ncbi:hypothetical protein SAMN05518672_104266 [Chitinophaga sp. CF118]|uniref:hypothetical protein n=1 Tax=Chitinophaga sp. CF118 TaxID=1884367 RepID=UPI0008F31AE5|nr:hypothetical protein [Chitinophaga sp. CF118]SFE04895.1 hypothetical protein SAMN05518672_104266 [Chitinophaga sp. CF118]